MKKGIDDDDLKSERKFKADSHIRAGFCVGYPFQLGSIEINNEIFDADFKTFSKKVVY